MKEKEFRSTKGLENENTPVQYDQFEMPDNLALRDRSIFDFSRNFVSNYTEGVLFEDAISGTKYYGRYYWENLSFNNDDVWSAALGLPGDAEIIKEGNYVPIPVSGPSLPVAESAKPVFSKDYTILNDDDFKAPIFDGDTVIYLESGTPSALSLTDWQNRIKFFRSGYIELTLKTTKQNCVLAYGSGTFLSGLGLFATDASGVQEQSYRDNVTVLDGNTAVVSDAKTQSKEITLEIKNGKLLFTYEDLYGENRQYFEIAGNKNISDGQWHHIVLNIGRPGIMRNHTKKYNQRYIEFWVDGQLDYKTFEHVNNEQIFFPVFSWAAGNAKKLFSNNPNDAWKTEDSLDDFGAGYSSPYNIYNKIFRRIFNESEKPNLFVGSFNTIVLGVNHALSKFEIQQRNRLFRGYENIEATQFVATSEMVMPTVTSNKKKVAKLFWNNLINDRAIGGVELDDTFDVYSYSVTHKTANSASEIYNLNLANKTTFTKLADVRVAIQDNVYVLAPGIVNTENYWYKYGIASRGLQWNAEDPLPFDGMTINPENTSDVNYEPKFLSAHIQNLTFSGVSLNKGDRVLLTNQAEQNNNGIWIYNGPESAMTRASDADSYEKIQNGIVYVNDGYLKGTTWMLTNKPQSLLDKQKWEQIEYYPDTDSVVGQPIFTQRWSDEAGNPRMINLQSDIDLSQFDVIAFMNYPQTGSEVEEHFVGFDPIETVNIYNDFIKSLKIAASNGASLHVSSTKLAEDLGIVSKFTEINQNREIGDARSSAINPFQFDEPSERYFDTHRINLYSLSTPVIGLTDKETWLLTDFINYLPKDQYDNEEWHAKYSYRQFGIQEGNEFVIPSISLRSSAENKSIPGYRNEFTGSDTILAVAPSDVLAGTVVTELANTYYQGNTVTGNPYDDYATTIIVHNGQLLGDYPINGKIFVNCVEDSYAMSRSDYNKAYIQVIPESDTNETVSTRMWQYSTSRLDRKPKTSSISAITLSGQTMPTNGGGGPLIQSLTHSSSGIIRNKADENNDSYKSDLYPTQEDEIYPLQEIPVLSMTWLGLNWLAG